MKKMLLLMAILLVSACTVVEAGKVKKERKELYDYHDSTEFCNQHPDYCVNNIPWF